MAEGLVDPILCSIVDAQARLGGVSRDTVKTLLATGELESIKVLRRRMVIVATIDRYVERQREAAA